ncbi:MAG: MucB/RseB C-terminal domain-containing protein [Panacagrimonas sp.]
MRLGIFAAGLVFASGVHAADEAGDWLVKVSQAARLSNYEGVLVYRGGDMLETFRVTHRFAEGSERERVQSMTGEVREVLKQNDKVTCLLPKDRRLTANRAATPKGLFQPLSAERLGQISAVYEFRELGEARVAGRNCRGIAIAPRDEFRYGYELWADRESGVPLKLSLVAPDGKLLEQMFFTEVQFPQSIPDTAFEAIVPEQEARQSTEAAADAIALAHEREPVSKPAPLPQAALPQLSKLPPGYRLIRREVRASKDGVREHLLLSDGLSAISVYRVLRPAAEANVDPRLDQMGPLNAYSRMVGKVYVTVVGEAPGRTVKMIADNVQAEFADLAPDAQPGEPAPVPN